MSVWEWGEYLVYDEKEVRIGRSYRIYDEKGELVSTGIEWATEEIRPGESYKEAAERARQRLKEKIDKIREKVEKQGGGKE